MFGNTEPACICISKDFSLCYKEDEMKTCLETKLPSSCIDELERCQPDDSTWMSYMSSSTNNTEENTNNNLKIQIEELGKQMQQMGMAMENIDKNSS